MADEGMQSAGSQGAWEKVEDYFSLEGEGSAGRHKQCNTIDIIDPYYPDVEIDRPQQS